MATWSLIPSRLGVKGLGVSSRESISRVLRIIEGLSTVVPEWVGWSAASKSVLLPEVAF